MLPDALRTAAGQRARTSAGGIHHRALDDSLMRTTDTSSPSSLAIAAALSMGALLGGALAERDEPTGLRRGRRARRRERRRGRRSPATRPQARATSSRSRRPSASLPRDADALTLLGYGYLQRWRETADASFLPRAGEALRRAQRLAPNDPLVLSGSARSRSPSTSFAARFGYGREARADLPRRSASPLGVVGDALARARPLRGGVPTPSSG